MIQRLALSSGEAIGRNAFWAACLGALLSSAAIAQDIPTAPDAPPPAAADTTESEEGDGRIVGGSVAGAGTAPWQVQIFAKGEGAYTDADVEDDRRRTDGKSKYLWMKKPWERDHRCGGVLIERDWVLTAAHCAKLPRAGNLLEQRGVLVGTQDLLGGGAEYRIERVVTHKLYSAENHVHDVALLRIVPDPKSSRRGPVRMARIRLLGSKPGDLPLMANPFVTVTGWGLTGERETSMSLMRDGWTVNRKASALMEVALSVLPQSRCARIDNYKTAMIPEIICAGSDDGRDSCNGDSGGPMTRAEGRERVLVGIVTFGNGCGIKGMPALYANASAYRKWVSDAIAASRPGQIIAY